VGASARADAVGGLKSVNFKNKKIVESQKKTSPSPTKVGFIPLFEKRGSKKNKFNVKNG